MASPFRRRGSRAESSRSRHRPGRDRTESVNRVALRELTPDLPSFLGQAAHLQLAIFETAALAVTTAPHAGGKAAMAQVARLSLQKYDGLIGEMGRAGLDASTTMERFSTATETFRAATKGADWSESLVAAYVIAGLLDDFFVLLADGLERDQGARIATLLAPDAGSEHIIDQLRSAIGADPRIASRLALWGRRLVGDTLLVARSALAVPEDTAPDEARLEPVFTEIIAAHTRRMDTLGLTA